MFTQYLNLVLVIILGALAAWLARQNNMAPAFSVFFVMVLIGINAFRTHLKIAKREAAATRQDNSRQP